MNDIVVGVRLNADGSGLVGQLRLSRAEMDQLRASEKGAAEAARDLTAVTAGTSKALQDEASAARSGTAATDAKTAAGRNAANVAQILTGATGQSTLALGRQEQAARTAGFQLSNLAERSAALVRAEKQAAQSSDQLTGNIGLQRVGWQQVGFQIQDVFASYASGSKLTTIFAQQSGQLASAIALIAQSAEGGKGKLAGLASFLGGPWGIALGVAVSAGTALIPMLMKSADAADLAKVGASGLADAQSVLGDIFDLTSGKIKTQNGLLVANARLMAINLRSEAIAQRASSAATFASADDLSWGQRARGYASAVLPDSLGSLVAGDYYGARGRQGTLSGLEAERARISSIKDQSARDDAISRFMAKVEKTDFSGLQVDRNQYLQAFVDALSAAEKDRVAKEIDKSLDTGVLSSDLRREDKSKPKKDNSAEKAAKEAERLAAFSDRAAEAVARLNDEYNLAPRDIDRARQSTAQLDGIIADVNKRLATGKNISAAQRTEFERIKADAEALKPVIQESLVRPVLDMLDGQERQIELGKLQTAGRQADAAALQLTYSLMDKMGVESEDQLATALAQRGVTEEQVRALYDNLEVMRQQTREMRAQQAIQNMFLGAVDDMRENVRLTVESLRKDGPKAIEDFGKRFLDVFDRLFADVATETLFGDFFRDLEDQLTGDDKVSKAGDKLAEEVGRAGKTIKQTSSDILDLGKAAREAVAAITNTPMAQADGTGAIGGQQGADEIIVTGQKGSGFKEAFQGVFKDFKKGLSDIFSDIFGDKGVFGKGLEATLGRVAGNAALGSASGSLVTGLLGVKGSGTGGMLGGAIGGALGKELFSSLGSFAGPLGSVLGGTIGSAVVGAFKSTPKASATITGGSDEDVSVTGNKSSLKKAAVGLASSVQDTLAQIAEEFGGSIGNFAVSIGTRHGDYRVDTSGSGKTKKKSGAVDFDDDEAGAIAYAVMDAITDGGIIGISAAVQKALNSSSDLDEAVAEALKVREVEKLLGGLGAELEEQFKAFEDQAKERVRIATQYGFDVVEIEKRNAEDRAKLIDEILTDRVGSLQQLLDDMKYGDLFEGSAADRREALLVEIAKARTAAEAGEDGAADKLAELLRQLTALSREEYGTAGDEYVSDRDSAISAAEAVIKAENDRIKQAQDAVAATNSKLDTANQLADEQVQYLAQIAAALGASATTANTGSATLDASLVTRQN